MPGPNDFHFDGGVMKSGLGPDEPSETQKVSAAGAAEEHRRREEALASTAAEIRNEARALEERRTAIDRQEADLAAKAEQLKSAITSEFDQRQADLDRREAELSARLAAAEEAERRRLATDRAPQTGEAPGTT
jgi:chromosome segregation ATPase